MDPPTTVIGLVTALVQTYAAGLDHYTRWKRKRSQQNHYRRGGTGQQRTTIPTCALSTSLSVSGPQIKETYDIAFAIVGTEFSTGDATCRDILWTQLNDMNDRVTNLQRMTTAPTPGPLDLAEVLQASEAARFAAVSALTEQYQRLAAGRPIPKELPVPKPRSRQDGQFRMFDSRMIPQPPPIPYDDDDRMTTAMTIISGPLRFQSEPPSPPPTPKIVPDDLESTWGGTVAPSESGRPGTSAGGHLSVGGMLRPKNSVFSIFCPEAMTLQVDLKKSIPNSKKCKCGYRWKPAPTSLPADSVNSNPKATTTSGKGKEKEDDKDETLVVLLKEGFRLTPRFLAKSHCEKEGYGCVLCTSTGRTDTYETVEDLRAHINVSHTKWQMLHDRDMT